MGLTAQYFGVLHRAGRSPSLPASVADRWEATTGQGRWSLGLVDESDAVSFEAGLTWFEGAAGASSQNPVFTALVEDSDYCVLSVAAVRSAHVVIKPSIAADYRWGEASLALAASRSDPTWGLSDWLREVGLDESAATELVERLATEDFVNAEKAIWLFLDALGLESQALETSSAFIGADYLADNGVVIVAGRDVNLAKARYVLGYGEDFIGIWDRERPGDPIETFPEGPDAREQAKERHWELLEEWLSDS